MSVIEKKLKNLPDESGVYIMLDENKSIIYIGKAKSLKNRVRQYFHSKRSFDDKTLAMVTKIADFNYIITHNEADAIALEANLIKKHKPPYNILLKDDKRFPYICVDLREHYPVFKITRQLKKDGCKYFGPFMGGIRASELLEIIGDAFMLKSCKLNITKKSKNHRPCLNYHIGKCVAPCNGEITEKQYRKLVMSACNFLKGNGDEINEILFNKMQKLSDSQQYEAAAAVRDRIAMIKKLKIKRVAALPRSIAADAIAYFGDGEYGVISLLVIREGNIIGAKNFALQSGALFADETLSSFITQYYSHNEPPKEIILGSDVGNEALEFYLSKKFNFKVSVLHAKKGNKKKLADMAVENAKEYLYKYIEDIKYKKELTEGAVKQLSQMLRLKKLPRKIECYDISHISGTDKTASMAVFTGGEKNSALYRRFRINLEGNDDFGSIREVIKRRFDRYTDGDFDESFSVLPDLVIIDGGKGQLSSAAKILEESDIDVEIISIAKKNEEIFTLSSNVPFTLPPSSLALRLVQRIRDEAHRFALSYHKKLREKHIASELDNIKGIGEKKRKALIKMFGSIENIKNADTDSLTKVEGISVGLAKNITEYFGKQQNSRMR
jgi:excinuclease ABC subunit C